MMSVRPPSAMMPTMARELEMIFLQTAAALQFNLPIAVHLERCGAVEVMGRW